MTESYGHRNTSPYLLMKTPKYLPALLSVLAASAFTAKGAVIVYEGFQYSEVGDDLDAVTTVDVAPTGLTGG